MKDFCIFDDKFLYFIFADTGYFMLKGYGVGAKNIDQKIVFFLDFTVKNRIWDCRNKGLVTKI